MMRQPSLVFVPGAWHRPKAWARFSADLKASGYTGSTSVINLSAVGAAPDSDDVWSIAPDIRAIRDAISQEIDQGKRVIVVSHSWGSIPANEALRKFRDLDSGKVKHLIVAGFMLPEGESMLTALGGKPPPLWDRRGDFVYANGPRDAFYNDLPPALQDELVADLTSHTFVSKITPLSWNAWQHIPTTFLYATNDNAIPAFISEAMVATTQQAGAKVDVRRVSCGHTVMLAKPDATIDVLKEMAL